MAAATAGSGRIAVDWSEALVCREDPGLRTLKLDRSSMEALFRSCQHAEYTYEELFEFVTRRVALPQLAEGMGAMGMGMGSVAKTKDSVYKLTGTGFGSGSEVPEHPYMRLVDTGVWVRLDCHADFV